MMLKVIIRLIRIHKAHHCNLLTTIDIIIVIEKYNNCNFRLVFLHYETFKKTISFIAINIEKNPITIQHRVKCLIHDRHTTRTKRTVQKNTAKTTQRKNYKILLF